jgi:F-type H+-transporting ATPase subunit gamma
VVSGRKAEGYFRYRGYRVDEVFTGYTERPSYEDARRLGEAVTQRYQSGEIDRVDVVYTRFLSVGSQRVTNVRLLPLEKGAMEDAAAGAAAALYEIEPDADTILERLLPRYVDARLFAALLEAAASEHAARQRAMKAATDNAEELIKNLSIVANKVRQAGITTEIMEIVGGAEALRQAKGADKEDLLGPPLVSRDVLPDQLDQSGARA